MKIVGLVESLVGNCKSCLQSLDLQHKVQNCVGFCCSVDNCRSSVDFVAKNAKFTVRPQ